MISLVKYFTRHAPLVGSLSVLVTFLPPSLAAEGDLTLSGEVGAVSDYVFRGVSRSDGDPAVQANLDIAHADGFYFGTFLSSIDDPKGHDFEAEGYFGYGLSKGAWDYNLSLGIDSFHGNSDSDLFAELRATVSRDFGFAYARSGFYFAPDDREIGLGRSIYVFTEGDIYVPAPGLPPITINLRLGYEDYEGGLSKWDWGVGLFVQAAGLEWGLRYSDTNRRFIQGSRSRVIFGAKKYF